MPNAGIDLTMFILRQHHWLPVVQYICSILQRLAKKRVPVVSQGGTGQLTIHLKWTGIRFNTCVLTLKCALAQAIYIFVVFIWYSGTGKCLWSTKGLKNCCTQCCNWSYNVQTEAISQAASCPARLFFARENMPKTYFQWSNCEP